MAVGIEPTHKSFADSGLTTWLRHLMKVTPVPAASADTPAESGRRDLNSRPPPWQGGALPLSYSRTNLQFKPSRIICRFELPRAQMNWMLLYSIPHFRAFVKLKYQNSTFFQEFSQKCENSVALVQKPTRARRRGFKPCLRRLFYQFTCDNRR